MKREKNLLKFGCFVPFLWRQKKREREKNWQTNKFKMWNVCACVELNVCLKKSQANDRKWTERDNNRRESAPDEIRYLNHRHRIISTPFFNTAVCLKQHIFIYVYSNTHAYNDSYSNTHARNTSSERARARHIHRFQHCPTAERDQATRFQMDCTQWSSVLFTSVLLVSLYFFLRICLSKCRSHAHTHARNVDCWI